MLTKKEITKIKKSMGENDTELSVVFKALSDPIRCKIFELISTDPQSFCVTDIAKYFDISLSAVSQKLKILETHGLIERKRYGKEICFTAKKNKTVNAVVKIIKKLRT